MQEMPSSMESAQVTMRLSTLAEVEAVLVEVMTGETMTAAMAAKA